MLNRRTSVVSTALLSLMMVVLSRSDCFGQVSYSKFVAETVYGPIGVIINGGQMSKIAFQSGNTIDLAFIGPPGIAPGNVVEPVPSGGTSAVAHSWFYMRPNVPAGSKGILANPTAPGAGVPIYYYGSAMVVDTNPVSTLQRPGFWRHIQLADLDGTTQEGAFGKLKDVIDTGDVVAPELPDLRPVLENVGGSTSSYYAGCVDLPGAFGVFGFPTLPGDPSGLRIRDFAFETWVVRLDGPTVSKKDVHPPDPKTLNQPLAAGFWSWGFKMTTQAPPLGRSHPRTT
ncbi:MAG: hypothetical protein HYY93_11420 [Planctomycetes bacterium]|nr:hypothetical protein [Planctomycetota bacterium]